MSVNEIMNYVRQTPGNTNPNVIKSMVESEISEYIEEAANTALRKLGVREEQKTTVIAFDGNTDGKEIVNFDGESLVRLSKTYYDLNTVEKVVARGNESNNESNNFTIDNLGPVQVMMIKFVYDDIEENLEVLLAVAEDFTAEDGTILPVGVYFNLVLQNFICPCEFHFAETIHSINPKYLPRGGVGYTEKEVYTYDGNGSTSTLDKWGMHKITDKEIDLSTIVRVVAKVGSQTIEGTKDDLIIETYLLGGITIQKVFVKYEGATLPIIMLYGGTWVLDDSGVGVYISRIETEIIHSIDPKYLPGVCLPVVEITSAKYLADSLVNPSADESAKLEAAHQNGGVMIIKFEDAAGIAVTAVCGAMAQSGLTIYLAIPNYQFMRTAEGVWVMGNGTLEMSASE